MLRFHPSRVAVGWDMAASQWKHRVFVVEGDPTHPTGRKYVIGVGGGPQRFWKPCVLTTLPLAQFRSWHTVAGLINGMLDV